MRRLVPLVTLFLMLAGLVAAQRSYGGGRSQGGRSQGGWGGWSRGESRVPDSARTAREVESHSSGTPEWKNAPGHEKDVFTFVRVRRSSGNYGRGGWATDTPDADLNFSYRLQQLTSLRTDPNGRVLRLSDPDLTDFPLIMMEHPGYISLKPVELVALRNYLTNGGALFVSDFWSTREWNGFAEEMKRVFPDRAWTDVPMEHPIFHCVFDLQMPKNKLQVPNIRTGMESQYSGITFSLDETLLYFTTRDKLISYPAAGGAGRSS